jgi:hypothetical protein
LIGEGVHSTANIRSYVPFRSPRSHVIALDFVAYEGSQAGAGELSGVSTVNSESQSNGNNADEGRSMLSDADIARLAAAIAAVLRDEGILSDRSTVENRQGKVGSGRKRRLSSLFHADVILASVALLIVVIVLIAWAV